MPKVSAARLAMLCLLLLAAVLSPAASETDMIRLNVPNGSYFTTCDKCVYSFTDFTYSCKCQNRQGNDVSTSIALANCTPGKDTFYYLTNEDGKLTCSTP